MKTDEQCPDCNRNKMCLSFDGEITWIFCQSCGFDSVYGDGDLTQSRSMKLKEKSPGRSSTK